MPSRHAHRAALRRSKEPACIPPSGVEAMPAMPENWGWRNPVRGYDYVRDEWELYRVHPNGSDVLATIRMRDGIYLVTGTGDAPRETADAVQAVAWAAEAGPAAG